MPSLALILSSLAGATVLAAAALLIRGALYRSARPLKLIVTRRDDSACDLFSITLGRPPSARWLLLPRFSAGQSVQLAIPGQAGMRRYSIARWNSRPRAYELTVRREPQGRFSPRLAEHAQVGAPLAVSRPGGHFTLPRRAEHPRAVFIAGGVGITPLLAMLDQWIAARGPYRAAHLYWQVRREQEALYRDALAELARRQPQLRVRILVSQPTNGPAERISTDLLAAELGSLSDTDFYLCSGSGLLDSMLAALRRAGVADGALHFERFTLGAGPDPEANWNVAYAGATFPFAGHASLLDAIEAQALPIDSDCRTGSCGRCLLAVEAGEARHRIAPECPVPPKHVLACCAIPGSDLRLRPAGAQEDAPGEAKPAPAGPDWRWLTAIAAAHAALLAALTVSPGRPEAAATHPPIFGVVVAAARPPEVAQPRVQPPSPERPKPRPAQRTRPAEPAALPATPSAPPSERAPAAEPAEATRSSQAETRSATAAAAGAASLAAPAPDPPAVIPPRTDAAHLNNPAPAYPAASRRFGEQGRVLLEVYILPDGSVGEIKLKRSSGYARLDDAAREAVRRWRYLPARRGSEPIPYWYIQPVAFALDG